MTLRLVNTFRGEVPLVAPELLQDNASASVVNARLFSGNLTAFRQFLETKSLANPGPVETIYLLKDKWLSWDQDVDVARGIIPGDTTYRTYITGLDAPRFTTYALATTGTEPYPVETRLLGVPAPDSPPTTVVAPDTSAPNTINVTDDGSNLAGLWTTVGQIPGAREVTQDAAVGNPAPSYKLLEDNQTAYAYRDFGTSDSSVTKFTTQFQLEVHGGIDGNDSQAGWAIGNTLDGFGARAQIGTNDTNAIFQLGTGLGWAVEWTASTLVALTLIQYTWYTFECTTSHNDDGTTTVTAYIRDETNTTELAKLELRQVFDKGGFFGFTTHGTGHVQSYHVDNITVIGSGSLNPATITNIATSYVYTFVNDLGEESAPTLPSATILRPDGVQVTVTTSVSIPTGVSGDYHIQTKRIYRAATGSAGSAFRFVAEIPLDQADYVDTLTDSQLGEVLQSDNWALPPTDLQGILALPNGIMVGFRENQLCLSAQNQPHAWPVEYRLNTDTKIVGIGNIDTTLVIGTESFVYTAAGNDPANYSMTKFEVPHAASSKRSFAYITGLGVVFSGPDGLLVCRGPNQLANLTESVFTLEQWEALDPTSIVSVAHNDIYYMMWRSGSMQGCYAVDLRSNGFGIVEMAFHASAVFVDPIEDKFYLVLDYDNEPDNANLPVRPTLPGTVDAKTIFQFDGDPTARLVFDWTSKLYLCDTPSYYPIAQVRAKSYTNLIALFYGDGVLLDTIVIKGETEFVLSDPGDAYTTFQMRIVGTDEVRVIEAADNVEELR